VVNLRPFPFFNGTINEFMFGSNSIYNAGQIGIRKRSRGGPFYRFNYSYSKSIDHASQLNGTSTGGLLAAAQDINNFRLDRARSDWDRGHVVTSAFSWMLPVGRGKKLFGSASGLRQSIIGGWQISGTAFFATGNPFTPVAADTNLNLGESQKPNRIGRGIPGELPGPAARRRLSVVCDDGFCENATVCLGDRRLSRGQLRVPAVRLRQRGPQYFGRPWLWHTMNLSMMKNFRLQERKTIQFRFKSFNALNHPNFRMPNNQFNSTQAGLTTDVAQSGRGGSRVFQASLKFDF
jgi:hypothetical protein